MLKSTFDDIVNPKGRVQLDPTDTDDLQQTQNTVLFLHKLLILVFVCLGLAIQINYQIISESLLIIGMGWTVAAFLISLWIPYCGISILATGEGYRGDKVRASIISHKVEHFKFYLYTYWLLLSAILVSFICQYMGIIGKKPNLFLTIIFVIVAGVALIAMQGKLTDISNTGYKYMHEN